MKEKFYAKNRNLYFAFVYPEKAFDRVPSQVLWWPMRRVRVDEWMIHLVQAIYHNALLVLMPNRNIEKV